MTTYQAGVMQATAHRLLQRRCDEVLQPYGLTKAQWLVLGTVWDGGAGGVRVTDLARLLDTTLPYLTNTLKALEAKHMVHRMSHEGDGRSRLIAIEPDYEPTLREIEQVLREALRETIYGVVGPEEFRIYTKVLHALTKI